MVNQHNPKFTGYRLCILYLFGQHCPFNIFHVKSHLFWSYLKTKNAKNPIFQFQIAPYASVIINGVYWDAQSPRLITIPDAKNLLTPVQRVSMCFDKTEKSGSCMCFR